MNMRMQFIETAEPPIVEEVGNKKLFLKPTDGQRLAVIRQMHAEFERPENPLPIDFNAESDEPLKLLVWRFGLSTAVVWFERDDADDWRPIAMSSALLGGDHAPTDVQAVQALRTYEPPLPFDPKRYNEMLAAERPCSFLIHLTDKWFQNGRLELLATTLAAARMTSPDGTPGIEFTKALSDQPMHRWLHGEAE